VIALPLLAPIVNVTRSRPAETRTDFTALGGLGAPTIRTGEGDDAALAPTTLLAWTVHR
jgi:hypothetical protein